MTSRTPRSAMAFVLFAGLAAASGAGHNGRGELKVTSFPPGARLIIDGRSTGKLTPTTVTLGEGSHSITVEAPGSGWNAETRTVTIARGRNEVHLTITPALTVGPPGPKGDMGRPGRPGPKGDSGPALASFDELQGLACTLSGQAGVLNISYSAGGVATLTCQSCADADHDGFPAGPGCGLPVDCDDQNAAVHPGATEICANQVDDNCDGQVDEGCPFQPPCAVPDGSVGCEFYAVTMSNRLLDPQFPFGLAVVNGGPENADLVIDGGGLGAAFSTTVAAGGAAQIVLPWVPSLSMPTGGTVLVKGGAYHIRSTRPVTAYQFNPLQPRQFDGTNAYTSGASLLPPTAALGTSYRVAAWPSWMSQPGLTSWPPWMTRG